MNSTSPKFALNSIDWKKAFIGLGVAAGGAALTYIASFVANTNFGEWTPIVVAIASFIVNVGRKFIANYSPKLP